MTDKWYSFNVNGKELTIGPVMRKQYEHNALELPAKDLGLFLYDKEGTVYAQFIDADVGYDFAEWIGAKLEMYVGDD